MSNKTFSRAGLSNQDFRVLMMTPRPNAQPTPTPGISGTYKSKVRVIRDKKPGTEQGEDEDDEAYRKRVRREQKQKAYTLSVFRSLIRF